MARIWRRFGYRVAAIGRWFGGFLPVRRRTFERAQRSADFLDAQLRSVAYRLRVLEGPRDISSDRSMDSYGAIREAQRDLTLKLEGAVGRLAAVLRGQSELTTGLSTLRSQCAGVIDEDGRPIMLGARVASVEAMVVRELTALNGSFRGSRQALEKRVEGLRGRVESLTAGLLEVDERDDKARRAMQRRLVKLERPAISPMAQALYARAATSLRSGAFPDQVASIGKRAPAKRKIAKSRAKA